MATCQDLCSDSGQGETLGRFWAYALGLRFVPDDGAGVLRGDTPEQTVWMNVLPEARTVKHRVHLDLRAGSIEELVEHGALLLQAAEDYHRPRSVLTDPDGGDFWVFLRVDLPDCRLYELVIDAPSPRPIAARWADMFGASLDGDEGKGWWRLRDIPGFPGESWTFVPVPVPVPEPKTVKYRVQWDVRVESEDVLGEMTSFGAKVLRPRDDEIGRHVMADPEGNEFCVFVAA